MSTYEHGTRARYVRGGCRCSACRAANTAYQKLRQRRIGYGLSPTVEAGPVRRHVLALMSSPYPGANDGIGWRRVADLAEVSRSVVRGLVYGRRGKATRRIKRQNAERLLAVGPDQQAAGALVSAEEVWRQIRELRDFGIPKTRIARALGSRAWTPALQLGRHGVRVWKARMVERLHWETWLMAPRFREGCSCNPPAHLDLLARLQAQGDDTRRENLVGNRLYPSEKLAKATATRMLGKASLCVVTAEEGGYRWYPGPEYVRAEAGAVLLARSTPEGWVAA